MRARKKVPVGLSVGQSVGRRIWHRCWGLEKTFDSLFKIFILTPRRLFTTEVHERGVGI